MWLNNGGQCSFHFIHYQSFIYKNLYCVCFNGLFLAVVWAHYDIIGNLSVLCIIKPDWSPVKQMESILLIGGIREPSKLPQIWFFFINFLDLSNQVLSCVAIIREPVEGCLPADRCVYLSPLHSQMKDDQIQPAHQRWHCQHGVETSLVTFRFIMLEHCRNSKNASQRKRNGMFLTADSSCCAVPEQFLLFFGVLLLQLSCGLQPL